MKNCYLCIISTFCGNDTQTFYNCLRRVFSEVWKQVEPKITGLPLVAHNKAFDEACLKAVFRTYCMDYPDYEFYCTYQASRKLKGLRNHQLHTVAEFFGFDLKNHHHALADAEACAWIARYVL